MPTKIFSFAGIFIIKQIIAMSKYKDNFDKLANSIYDKIMEAAQIDPTTQAQQPVVTAPAQPQAGQVAGPVADTSAGATMPADAGVAGSEQAQMASVEPGAEGQEAQAGTEGEDTGEADEVGISEIQEMAGQLAQMIRDFKETNPDEFVEAAKFAAGMVISAAIKGLKYRDRKDILKKVKAGEFNQDGSEESGSEEQPVEQQPEGQEEMVAERLRKDDSRESDEGRRGLNPKEKKNIRSKKSPFSGVNENDGNATIQVGDNTPNADAEAAANKIASDGGDSVTFEYTGSTGESGNGIKPIKNSSSVSDALANIRNFGNKYQYKASLGESVMVTKRQLDMIRLSETKTKFVKFSKKQLDEIMKK